MAKGPGERERRQRPHILLLHATRTRPRFFPRPAAFGKAPVRCVGAAAREHVYDMAWYGEPRFVLPASLMPSYPLPIPSQTIPQPLNRRTGNKNRPFKRVSALAF